MKSGRWIQITHQVYLVLPDAVSDRDWVARREQRALVAALRADAGVVPTGFSALALAGIQGAPLDFAPEVACRPPHRLRASSTLRVRRVRANPDGPRYPRLLTVQSGVVVAPVHAIAQVASRCDKETLVSILDSALNTNRITVADLDVIDSILAGQPGRARFRAARELADGRAESPLESRGRISCVAHGVAPSDLQREIHDALGRFIARCDLVWELGDGRLLIVELDGEHHRRDGRIDRDNARDTKLTMLGHRVIHLRWADVESGHLWRLVRSILVAEGVLAA